MPDAETKAPQKETPAPPAAPGAAASVAWKIACALGGLAGLGGAAFGAVALGADMPLGGGALPKVALVLSGVFAAALGVGGLVASAKARARLRWLAEYERQLRETTGRLPTEWR